MSAPIIQAEYDLLEEVAQRFIQQAANTREMTQAIQRHADLLVGGNWQGRGLAAFDAEMGNVIFPALARLSEALDQGGTTTREISTLIQAAEEEAAAPFRAGEAGHFPAGPGGSAQEGTGVGLSRNGANNDTNSSSSTFFDRVLDIATGIVDAADKLDDIIPIPAAIALASTLRNGTTYAGQILVRAPQWLKRLGIDGRRLRDLAGVAENLSHIKGANMARHVARISRKIPLLGWVIAAGQGVTSVANVWNQNWDAYGRLETPERISAMSVDAGIALLPVAAEVAGGVVGATAGAYAGGAIGGAIGALGGPFAVITVPAGAAAGALIGGAVGGFIGDWVGGKAGDWAVDQISAAGGRDKAIEFVTDNVTQPIADGINSVVDEVSSWRLPDINIPSFGFSW